METVGSDSIFDVRNVSRETVERLATYEKLLNQWQHVKNLVGPSTIDDLWQRHFADSAQLRRLAPHALSWIDLGSGAGFPGLVIAILLQHQTGAVVHLVESNRRKCAFLRTVIRETGCRAEVHAGRIEEVLPDLPVSEVICARALAPLGKLLEWSGPLIGNGALGLFPRGQDVASELTKISKYSNFNYQLVQSLTDKQSSIVVVSAARLVDLIEKSGN